MSALCEALEAGRSWESENGRRPPMAGVREVHVCA